MSAAEQWDWEELDAEVRRDAARRACWRAGNLSYHCSEIQVQARSLVYEAPSRRVVWETNRRFGKSRTCVVIAGEHALAFPGVRIPYAAPTAKQVRNFVHPHMLEIGLHAPEEIAPELVNGEWVFPPLQWYDEAGREVATKLDGGVYVDRMRGRGDKLFSSKVASHGCEDRRKADALRGTGTVFAAVDEARDIPILQYVLGSVIGPMLWEARSRWHEDVEPVMLVATTVPERLDHPFVAVADAAKAKGAHFHATVYDCDHLSERDIEDAIEEAGGEDTPQWLREGKAERERDPRYVSFTAFDKTTHVIESEPAERCYRAIIGDGGFVDQAGFLFGYYDYARATYVIEDECVFRRTKSVDQSDDIEQCREERWPDEEVERRRVDAPPQVRADMNREEWGPEDSHEDGDPEPPHWQSVTKPRGRGGKGSMERGVNTANVYLSGGRGRRVEIHPRCVVLIAQLDSCRWNSSRTDFERVHDENGEVLHHYDLAAAFVYFLRDVNTANPYPKAAATKLDEFRKHRREKSEEDRLRGLFRRKRR